MKDLRSDIGDLARSLTRLPSRDGARMIVVMGADDGVGTSSVAASLALLLAGRSARATWLVDLDLMGNTQFYAFQARAFGSLAPPGRALDASLNTTPFFHVSPQLRTSSGQPLKSQKLLSVHQVEPTKLYVSRFRTDQIKQGQKVQVHTSGAYWQPLRTAVDWIIVDGLAHTSSRAGLAVCRHADGVVGVLQADKTKVDQINTLRDEVEAHGGTMLGTVMNRLKADARFASRFSL